MRPFAVLVAALALLSFSVFNTSSALADKARVEVGALTCGIYAKTNFIIGAKKEVDCDFTTLSGKVVASYGGEIKKFGLNLGDAKKAVIKWVVLAPTSQIKSSSLNGTYVGVAADVALGLGGGAKVLVGGSGDTITLQPVSVQAQRGLNIAVGVAEMNLYTKSAYIK